jgi:hypothetical protein
VSTATLVLTILLSLFAGAVAFAKLTTKIKKHRPHEKDITISHNADDD